jgi:hypothetical protein
MIIVGNQSDLKKKKKLPTSNFETSNLCKPTTTTEQNKNSHLKKSLTYFLNFSRTDLKKTQHWKKKKKKKKLKWQRKEEFVDCTTFSSSLLEPKMARRLFPSSVVRLSFGHFNCSNTSSIGMFSCSPSPIEV